MVDRIEVPVASLSAREGVIEVTESALTFSLICRRIKNVSAIELRCTVATVTMVTM